MKLFSRAPFFGRSRRHQMGKDRNGKELGKGLRQRPDGLYQARFTGKRGRRINKTFDNLKDAERWIADTKYEDEHDILYSAEDVYFKDWGELYVERKITVVRESTIINYKNQLNIMNKTLGRMKLSTIKPIHCEEVILGMVRSGYSRKTIFRIKTLMKAIFQSAVENDKIAKNPVTKSVVSMIPKHDPPEKATKRTKYLTIEDQKSYSKLFTVGGYYHFLFVLQTGLRMGEMMGLKWSDIDFENRTLHVQRTIFWKKSMTAETPPKSEAGDRIIPLTAEAIRLLNLQRMKNESLPCIPSEFKDRVFLSKVGKPITDESYSVVLANMSEMHDLPYISMHSLRHTFATRCIEGGMNPKILQGIMGHSTINMTMDLYVHVTEDEKRRQIELVEPNLRLG